MKVTAAEKRKYPLPDKEDLAILEKIKEVEKYKLNKKDKGIVKLIRTQLEDDWRTPLIKYLNKMLRECKK